MGAKKTIPAAARPAFVAKAEATQRRFAAWKRFRETGRCLVDAGVDEAVLRDALDELNSGAARKAVYQAKARVARHLRAMVPLACTATRELLAAEAEAICAGADAIIDGALGTEVRDEFDKLLSGINAHMVTMAEKGGA